MATKKKSKSPRKGSALAKVASMLARPGGCTREQVLKAIGWAAVSLQQQAAAAGVTLKIDKTKRPFTYRAE